MTEAIFEQLFLAPAFNQKVELVIEAMAPLSMVTNQVGEYYYSLSRPTENMVWGMIENACGWHFDEHPKSKDGIRKLLSKKILKSKDAWVSPSGFCSLLQDHVTIESISSPKVMRYTDLSKILMCSPSSTLAFLSGVQNFDVALQPLWDRVKLDERTLKVLKAKMDALESEAKKINKSNKTDAEKSSKNSEAAEAVEAYRVAKTNQIIIADSDGGDRYNTGEKDGRVVRHDSDVVNSFRDGEIVAMKAISDLAANQFSGTAKREYVVPSEPYVVSITTSTELAKELEKCVNFPSAFLYLGKSDGLVEATWINL